MSAGWLISWMRLLLLLLRDRLLVVLLLLLLLMLMLLTRCWWDGGMFVRVQHDGVSRHATVQTTGGRCGDGTFRLLQHPAGIDTVLLQPISGLR
uniref:Putative secreted protein n=1 Tax=Anopheles darlingi TaxID=43151 RepID=A0A2M4D0T1_ANODA